MRLDEFEDGLSEYGVALESWPAEKAAAALSLLRESAEARDILAFERQLDAELRAGAEVKAPAALADRIVAQAQANSSATRRAGAPHIRLHFGRPSARRPLVSAALRYAAVFVVCFGGGVAVAHFSGVAPDSSGTSYVSDLYAGLAW